MLAAAVLTNVAIVLVAATIWDDLRRQDRATPRSKGWLTIASIFAVVSAVLQVVQQMGT